MAYLKGFFNIYSQNHLTDSIFVLSLSIEKRASARTEKPKGEILAMRITNVFVAMIMFVVFATIAWNANAEEKKTEGWSLSSQQVKYIARQMGEKQTFSCETEISVNDVMEILTPVANSFVVDKREVTAAQSTYIGHVGDVQTEVSVVSEVGLRIVVNGTCVTLFVAVEKDSEPLMVLVTKEGDSEVNLMKVMWTKSDMDILEDAHGKIVMRIGPQQK